LQRNAERIGNIERDEKNRAPSDFFLCTGRHSFFLVFLPTFTAWTNMHKCFLCACVRACSEFSPHEHGASLASMPVFQFRVLLSRTIFRSWHRRNNNETHKGKMILTIDNEDGILARFQTDVFTIYVQSAGCFPDENLSNFLDPNGKTLFLSTPGNDDPNPQPYFLRRHAHKT